tara:strand:+ start:3602 stop:4783 length:1182 start_codon:yes stop_codon:yes gene_type:complete
MSCNEIININNISKTYKCFDNKIDIIKNLLFKANNYTEYTAIKNISLSINKGQSIGIIGSNGAGKSTLLQLISGISKPTTGNVIVKGKMTSLLELGAGFNPEFTGKENIIISAMIYGLTKEEAKQKLNEIISFADIGDYINMPTKTYSTGMYVRLAFSVAIHVDSEILIIDEALSVGDAKFSYKCMNHIRKFREKGTIVLVSHDINAICNFCDICLWIDQGEKKMLGSPKDVTTSYINSVLKDNSNNNDEISIEKTDENIFSDNTIDIKNFDINQEKNNINISIQLKIKKDLSNLLIGFIIKDKYGQVVSGETFSVESESIDFNKVILGQISFKLPKLNNGKYFFSYSIADGTEENHEQHYWRHDAFIFDIHSNENRYGIIKLEDVDYTFENE